MNEGQTSPQVVAAVLSNWPNVFYRALLWRRSDSLWRLHRCIIDAVPPGSTERTGLTFRYLYGDVAVIAGQMEGSIAAAMLTEPGPFTLSVPIEGGNSAHFVCERPGLCPATPDSVSWQRFPSGIAGDLGPLPWPHHLYTIGLQASLQRLPDRIFVAEGCPFFPDLGSLVNDLLYDGDEEYRPAWRYESEALQVRTAQTDLAIQHIHISSTAITVTVQGKNIKGSQLEISAPPRMRHAAQFTIGKVHHAENGLQIGKRTVRVTEKLPQLLWVVVSRGDEWLDHRHVEARWSPFAYPESGVIIEPPDLATQIQEYIYQGEGPRIEFKQDVPPKREKMLKTVAAFANGDGGVILIGVKNDDGAIVGAARGKRSVNKLLDDLGGWIRSTVLPEPEFKLDVAQIEGKAVVAIFVAPGTARPYGITPSKPTYYVRRGASSFPAGPEEIRSLVQTSMHSPVKFRPAPMQTQVSFQAPLLLPSHIDAG